MTAHQQKKLNEADLMKIRDRFEFPVSDEAVQHIGFIRPAAGLAGDEVSASAFRRMGGSLPSRNVKPYRIQGSGAGNVSGRAGRLARTRGFDHRGVRQRV